jgi:hypothetical protein
MLDFQQTSGSVHDSAINQVWYQLVGHGQIQHTPVETLNRLLEKAFARHYQDAPRAVPKIKEDQITSRLELWTTQQILSLRRFHDRDQPGSSLPADEIRELLPRMPVIVLRVDGNDYMIDGTTRTNRRLAEGYSEPHPVYLLTVDLSC